MGRIADDGLIEIPDLDGDTTIHRGDWSQITGVAVSTNPHRRPLRQRSALLCLKPFIKFDGTAPDVSVSGASHLESLPKAKRLCAIRRPKGFLGSHCEIRLTLNWINHADTDHLDISSPGRDAPRLKFVKVRVQPRH